MASWGGDHPRDRFRNLDLERFRNWLRRAPFKESGESKGNPPFPNSHESVEGLRDIETGREREEIVIHSERNRFSRKRPFRHPRREGKEGRKKKNTSPISPRKEFNNPKRTTPPEMSSTRRSVSNLVEKKRKHCQRPPYRVVEEGYG